MLKIIFSLLLFFSSNVLVFAENFKQFDIVETTPFEREAAGKEKTEKSETEHLKKGKDKKRYAIILSGNAYNNSGKNVIIAPVVLNEKQYKGKYTFNFKNGTSNYVIFVDKIRNVNQSKLTKSDLTLQEKEKTKVKEMFNSLSK